MRLLRNSLLVVLALALLAPGTALADARDDCAKDGVLQGNYTQRELNEALRNLPADLVAYSDCVEVLKAARPKRRGQGSGPGSGAGGGGGGVGSGGGAGASDDPATTVKPTPADLARERREVAAIDELAKGGGKPNLSLDGKTISPGDAGLYDLASATHEVPLPVKLALYAVGLLALAGLLVGGRRRFPALASGLLTAPQALLRRVSRLRR